MTRVMPANDRGGTAGSGRLELVQRPARVLWLPVLSSRALAAALAAVALTMGAASHAPGQDGSASPLDQSQGTTDRQPEASRDDSPGAPASLAGARRYLQQLRLALEELDLTEEQREGVEAVLSELRRNLARAVQDAEGDRDATAEEVGVELAWARAKLGNILTRRQQEQLRQHMQTGHSPARAQERRSSPPGDPEAPGEPAQPDDPKADPAMGVDPGMGTDPGMADPAMDPSMADDPGMQPPMSDPSAGRASPADRSADPAGRFDPRQSRFLDRLAAPAALPVGQKIPDDLVVVSLTGREIPLRGLVHEHRPLVVILGSASSPAFRQRLGDIPWLSRTLAREADIIVLYVREQHPAGGWEIDRNREEGISIRPHESLQERIDLARRTRNLAGLNQPPLRIQFVVDALDDVALLALAGDRPHQAALVISPDGTLSARQQWFDPTGIPALVEQARTRPRRTSD